MDNSLQEMIEKGLKALQRDETLVALMHLENALQAQPSPRVQSALAYCLACERRQFQQAQQLCQAALSKEPNNPEHYFYLGRIYLLARQKRRAIQTFRKGLKHKRYQPIIDELHRLGLRRGPTFPSLAREHFLNRSAGKLRAKLGNR